jgi:hypothetical protein
LIGGNIHSQTKTRDSLTVPGRKEPIPWGCFYGFRELKAARCITGNGKACTGPAVGSKEVKGYIDSCEPSAITESVKTQTITGRREALS